MEGKNPIPDLLESVGLAVGVSGEWKGLFYTWAEYSYEGRTLAKYLFTYTDAAYWQRWEQWGDHFVTEVIEPVYFSLANDTSWNLYWVSVMDEVELSQVDMQQRISFSSNIEYTRNLMAAREHLAETIPVGRIDSGGNKQEIAVPIEDWLTALDKEHLRFCLDSYSEQRLTDYAEGSFEEQETAARPVNSSEELQINSLQSVFIPRSFREHYSPKDWMIPFRTVNLLYGLNGAGKTSLLSAIELAVTGEIRSLSKAKDETVPDVILKVKTDGCEQELHPASTDMEKKQRERRFYKSRDLNSNRTAPQLQNLFHRFNYLSVEEAFRFASDQPDLSNAFSNILYGPETEYMWKNIQNYRSKSARLFARYKEELKNLDKRIQALPESFSVDRTSLRAYLEASGLKLDSKLQLEAILIRTQGILAEYDKVESLAPIPSQVQFQELRKTQEVRRRALEDMLQAASDNLKQASAIKEELASKVSKLKEDAKTVDRALTAIQDLKPLVEQLRFSVAHAEELKEYQWYVKEQTQWSETETRLYNLVRQYGQILESPPLKSEQQLREEIRKIQKRRQGLKESYDEIRHQKEQEEFAEDMRTQLLSSLNAAGLQIYQLDQQRHTCPLCGTDGITEDILRRHLEKEKNQGSQRLQELCQKELDIENAINKINSSLKRLDQQQIIAQEYKDALNAVKAEFPEIQDIASLRQKYDSVRRHQGELKEQAGEIGKLIRRELTTANLTASIEDILTSRYRLLHKAPAEYVALISNDSAQSMIAAVTSAETEWENRKRACYESLAQTEEAQKEQEGRANKYSKVLEENQKQMKQLHYELLRLDRISSFWAAVGPMTAEPVLSGEDVRNLCQKIHDQVRELIKSIQNEEERKHCQAERDRLEAKMERCWIMQAQLEELRQPESYAKTFIHQNVAQISRIFLALHSPQEFSGLTMEDGQLTVLRNEEKVPISHMSTGQRTALVISVFFQMNLAAPSVPRFLLLDEPVANIDDLNVLALMDFLREMTITQKRQIFFTTANRNVAKLFRRKFSFLLEDFQELYFLREKDDSLKIIKRIYNQSRLVDNSSI